VAKAVAEVWDVVIVGCGYAGAVAAIAAHDAGATVLVLEKTPQPGGISICSAGGIRVAEDADAAFEYLSATNAGTTPDEVLRTLAEGMTSIAGFVEELASAEGASIEKSVAFGNYPFPGTETFGFITVEGGSTTESLLDESCVRGGEDGLALFRLLHAAMRRRGIKIEVNARVTRLCTDARGNVVALNADLQGNNVSFRVKGGVVLACGGFESDYAMQLQYWQGTTARSAAFAGNTGDGIRMCQDVGADLWHMWHYHGSYGLRHTDPSYPFAIRMKRFPDWLPGEQFPDDVKMPWILIDQDGKRFMNEYDPYLQDTGARPFGFFDPQRQAFPRIPAWFIADENGRKKHPFGKPTYHQAGVSFSWSADNLAEVDLGIIQRADDIESLSRIVGVPAELLADTIARWNDCCAASTDKDFARPAQSMMPISEPPYYVGQVWPLVNNTQGGPVHDAQQRVLNPFCDPVNGLYAAGELGSAFGYLYISGGNIAECFIGGRIAGCEAAAQVTER
jgi:succinate dehydrogenase/fumarate reductase flavoprotein subunit